MLCETFGSDIDTFQYTSFVQIHDDDVAYFGQVNIPKPQVSLEQYESALRPIPDEDVYLLVPTDGQLTIASELLDQSLYIKRPALAKYADYKQDEVLHIIPEMLLHGARIMKAISQHPH